jgi:RimJ/RimL family protein N-acetyltransferase
MAAPEFETERLLVRRWRDSDVPALLAVYGDADAMRWVGDGRALTQSECIQWLAVTRRNYEQRRYGMFAIEDRSTRGTIGFCGIVHPGGQPQPEVKYALLRSHWGKGYATEAVTGLIAYGARAHCLTFIMATAAPQNLASHRVLLKAGMQRAALRANADGTFTQLFQWHAGHETQRRALRLAAGVPGRSVPASSDAGHGGDPVPPWRVIEADPQGADALALLREAAIEARALYPELAEAGAPWPTNVPSPRGGVYLVAYEGATPVACGALRPLGARVAEVRRMFVTRQARRRGLAKAILGALETHARTHGYAALKLETGHRQAPAIALYESQGFRRIPPFGAHAGDATSVCFEKCIEPARDGS